MSTEAQRRAWRKYYHTKVKPCRIPKKPHPILRYSCPICGMSPLVGNFERDNKLKLRLCFIGGRGRLKWIDISEFTGSDEGAINILYGKLFDMLTHISKKCISVLNSAIDRGAITKDEIISLLGLEPNIEELEKANQLLSKQFDGSKQLDEVGICQSRNVRSITSGATVLSGGKLQEHQYFQSPQRLKNVTQN